MAKFSVALVALILAIAVLSQEKGVQTAPLEQFQKRIEEYLKVRKMVADQNPKPKQTPSAKELAESKKQFTASLAKARAGTAQGNIFTPEIAADFRRLGKLALEGKDGDRVHTSLARAEPVKGFVRVNETYPESVPLQSMPPTLLMGLPKLPMELEYRLVGRTLILRDLEANLIIDFLPEAIP